MDLAVRVVRRQVPILVSLLAFVAIVTFGGDARAATWLQGEAALKRAEQAGIDVGAVIETVSPRVEFARERQGMLVSEDRLYRAQFGAAGFSLTLRRKLTAPELASREMAGRDALPPRSTAAKDAARQRLLPGQAIPFERVPAFAQYPASDPAPGYQYAAALAFDGTNYLVAWQDGRSGAGDIYGARVSPAGAVLDPDGIAISTAAGDQEWPALAFDGTNYLVAWQDGRSGAGEDIYGARVSPAGAVLDPGGIAISTAPGVQQYPALAFDGTSYFVAWQDGRSGAGDDIYGARVSPAGAVLDPGGIAISTAADDQGVPALAFEGTNYLVAWGDWRSGQIDIYGARVSPAGAVLDPGGIAFSTAPIHQTSPALAFDGTNYLVAWADGRSGTEWDIYGARVSPAGAVLDPGGIAISIAPGYQFLPPALAFDGTNYLVAWDDAYADIYGARVSPAGVVLDPGEILISTAEPAPPPPPP